MGVLEFFVWIIGILVIGVVAICYICMTNDTRKVEQENWRLKRTIAKNEYKINDIGGNN